MAKAYRIKTSTTDDEGTETLHRRYGVSQSDASAKKKELIEKLGVKRNDVTIEEIELPTKKSDLVAWLNTEVG